MKKYVYISAIFIVTESFTLLSSTTDRRISIGSDLDDNSTEMQIPRTSSQAARAFIQNEPVTTNNHRRRARRFPFDRNILNPLNTQSPADQFFDDDEHGNLIPQNIQVIMGGQQNSDLNRIPSAIRRIEHSGDCQQKFCCVFITACIAGATIITYLSISNLFNLEKQLDALTGLVENKIDDITGKVNTLTDNTIKKLTSLTHDLSGTTNLTRNLIDTTQDLSSSLHDIKGSLSTLGINISDISPQLLEKMQSILNPNIIASNLLPILSNSSFADIVAQKISLKIAQQLQQELNLTSLLQSMDQTKELTQRLTNTTNSFSNSLSDVSLAVHDVQQNFNALPQQLITSIQQLPIAQQITSEILTHINNTNIAQQINITDIGNIISEKVAQHLATSIKETFNVTSLTQGIIETKDLTESLALSTNDLTNTMFDMSQTVNSISTNLDLLPQEITADVISSPLSDKIKSNIITNMSSPQFAQVINQWVNTTDIAQQVMQKIDIKNLAQEIAKDLNLLGGVTLPGTGSSSSLLP